MTKLLINNDKTNKPTVLVDSELLFDTEGYIINRARVLEKSFLPTNAIEARDEMYRRFPNCIKEMDVSSVSFEIKDLLDELLESGYNVSVLNIVPNHPDTALGLTHRINRLRDMWGKDFCKRININCLDNTQFANRFMDESTIVLTDTHTDYQLTPDGKITHRHVFFNKSHAVESINTFLQQLKTKGKHHAGYRSTTSQ